MLIIAMLLGMDISALKSDNPEDFLEYDQAKEILLQQEADKEGGITHETFGD